MACNSFATRILPIFCVIKSNKITLSSPRSWGCFYESFEDADDFEVFPTLVGVFPRDERVPALPSRLPHARGGVSGGWGRRRKGSGSSPRSWGCFFRIASLTSTLAVFPTLVGVFLRGLPLSSAAMRLPHARGGVSADSPPIRLAPSSSPRSWGCFHCSSTL